jgi:hypothetical protein
MKKSLVLALAILSLVACQKSAQQTAQVAQNTQSALVIPAVDTWELAQNLAVYGYVNKSANALVEAADILVGVPVIVCEREKKNPVDIKPVGKLNTVDRLLADAITLSSDEALMGRIESVKSRAALISQMEGTRGAVGGAMVSDEIIYGNSDQVIYQDFQADQPAVVVVMGMGEPDLDAFIYDEDMNLVAQDCGCDYNCHISWVPSYTGRYYIRVVNNGNESKEFTLATN